MYIYVEVTLVERVPRWGMVWMGRGDRVSYAYACLTAFNMPWLVPVSCGRIKEEMFRSRLHAPPRADLTWPSHDGRIGSLCSTLTTNCTFNTQLGRCHALKQHSCETAGMRTDRNISSLIVHMRGSDMFCTNMFAPIHIYRYDLLK